MRFAFVTTEFPTARPTAGGLSSYVARMSRLLAEAGHEVEIFVSVDGPAGVETGPGIQIWNSCRVHHVQRRRSALSRLWNRLLRLTGQRPRMLQHLFRANAEAIAAAVGRAQAEAPFDVVHSTDHRGIGLYLAIRPGRLLVVRCSAAMDLYMACDGWQGQGSHWQAVLEEATIRRADLAFAPSRLVADHYSRKLGRPVQVLRPPAYLETTAQDVPLHPPADAPADMPLAPDSGPLPQRYLIHFAAGLIARKGTDLVAAALQQALRDEPGLTMIWVGLLDQASRAAWLAPLGAAAAQVICLPPLPKPELYALVRTALAAVLPSRVDNLPNTVIESLMLGVPVIGSRASSIEELVEDGVTGVLVDNGAVAPLAAAMVMAWRGTLPLRRDTAWAATAMALPFQPEAALHAYLGAVSAAPAVQPNDTST